MCAPHRLISQPGITRTRPSAKPRYQSGWAPVETWSARNGPYAQTGLIVATAASRVRVPKTRKKNPPAFARYTGINGAPTTLRSVRPGPANWVCLW